MPERVVALEGCLNFRDLGGYLRPDGRRVRFGAVYRSDALHALTTKDVAKLRDQLRIRHVIDLRSTAELEHEGRGALSQEFRSRRSHSLGHWLELQLLVRKILLPPTDNMGIRGTL